MKLTLFAGDILIYTENTKEAFIAAAQKRIDDYLGPDSGMKVSYSREPDPGEMTYYSYDTSKSDGKVYKLVYKNREKELLIEGSNIGGSVAAWTLL